MPGAAARRRSAPARRASGASAASCSGVVSTTATCASSSTYCSSLRAAAAGNQLAGRDRHSRGGPLSSALGPRLSARHARHMHRHVQGVGLNPDTMLCHATLQCAWHRAPDLLML